MRIFRSLIAVLFLVAAVPTPAQADTLITLSKPSFRLADGRFLNNDLASLLATDAELDTVLAKPIRGSRTWLIDPALFEEIADLGDGYVYLDAEGNEVTIDELPAAQQWLSLFTFVVPRLDPLRAGLTKTGSPNALIFAISNSRCAIQSRW